MFDLVTPYYSGVSVPPYRWHSGPGTRLKYGDRVWYVMPGAVWPEYEVHTATFAAIIVPQVHRIARLVTPKGGVEVACARLFVSPQEAHAEAQVLQRFAATTGQG